MCYNIRVDINCDAQKGVCMVNKVITALAVIGVFVIAGAFGNDDAMMFQHIAYPLTETLKTVFIGALMTVPAIVRSVYGEK